MVGLCISHHSTLLLKNFKLFNLNVVLKCDLYMIHFHNIKCHLFYYCNDTVYKVNFIINIQSHALNLIL